MARFISITPISWGRELIINIDQITSFYGNHTGTYIWLSNRPSNDPIHTTMPVEEFKKLISEDTNDNLPDKDTILRLIRSIDDLKNAIGRMPTSIRMHY